MISVDKLMSYVLKKELSVFTEGSFFEQALFI